MLVRFTFSPFDENTYLVVDEDSRECMIVDPGCYDEKERATLKKYIEAHALRPVRLFNTHAHLDHVFGNRFVFDTWGLLPEMHEGELSVLAFSEQAAKMYGLREFRPSPDPQRFWAHGETLEVGRHRFELRFVPGHSPASLCLVHLDEGYVIAGDVLFQGSIGRYDLPGGDLPTLLDSIRTQLFSLPAETRVFPGHGEDTTVGEERRSNPFLR
jgi:hydroxyacylglutathione hydrolase